MNLLLWLPVPYLLFHAALYWLIRRWPRRYNGYCSSLMSEVIKGATA